MYFFSSIDISSTITSNLLNNLETRVRVKPVRAKLMNFEGRSFLTYKTLKGLGFVFVFPLNKGERENSLERSEI